MHVADTIIFRLTMDTTAYFNSISNKFVKIVDFNAFLRTNTKRNSFLRNICVISLLFVVSFTLHSSAKVYIIFFCKSCLQAISLKTGIARLPYQMHVANTITFRLNSNTTANFNFLSNRFVTITNINAFLRTNTKSISFLRNNCFKSRLYL